MLLLPKRLWEQMVAHCLDCLPLEGCGLLAGTELDAWTEVSEAHPARNAAGSARLYEVEPKDLLAADHAAEAAGLTLLGVWHSHTHTEAYPSPTDVRAGARPRVALRARFAV